MPSAYHMAMEQMPPPEPAIPDNPPQAPVSEPPIVTPTTPVGPDAPPTPAPMPLSV